MVVFTELSGKEFTKCFLILQAKGNSIMNWKPVRQPSTVDTRETDNAEFGHFMLWQRNVARIIMHMHSHCSAHETFCLVTLPLLSWFS